MKIAVIYLAWLVVDLVGLWLTVAGVLSVIGAGEAPEILVLDDPTLAPVAIGVGLAIEVGAFYAMRIATSRVRSAQRRTTDRLI